MAFAVKKCHPHTFARGCIVKVLVLFQLLVLTQALMRSSGLSSSRVLLSRVRTNGRFLATSADGASASEVNKGRVSSAVAKDGAEVTTVKKGKMDLNPPKGTRDFFPEDQRLRNWLFGKWKNIAHRYGFEEYDAPVLESEELYIRKAGEEVTQQLYNFEDKGGRRLALRPEMTPSLARMVLSRKGGLSFPLKWFSLPQCWRYERMTRGRRREHYQWNMDIWGVEGVEAEAELLSAIVTSFKDMGIGPGDVGIKINSRKILTGLMASLGVPEDKFAPTCVLVDKLEKVPLDALLGDLQELGLSRVVVEELVASLQIKDLAKFSEKLGSQSEGVKDLEKLFELAEGYGIREWLEFDASVVRGLSYYTGVVFEGFDKSGELRAICGGGRYDALLESMGGDRMPAVGFGFGDAVIVELLKMKGLLPDTTQSSVQVLMFPMVESLRGQAVAAATALRSAGISVDVVLESRKPKWVFQRADKLGAEAVVMFAPDEAVNGQVVVKSLATGEQITHNTGDIVAAVLNVLKTPVSL